MPTKTENAPIVGESSIHTLDDLKRRRPNEVAFLLAKLTLEKYFRDDDGNDKPWLFPQLLGIAKRWLAECVTLKDNTFPQLLLLIEFAHDAADRIYKAIVASTDGTAALKPILRPYDTLGSTRYVDFDTTRPVFATRDDKCHISHVVADTDSWEQKMAQALEDMPEVVRYVKNHNLGFTIPYTLNGEERHYIPDFIACIDDGHGPDDLLNLIVEVTGEKKKDKAAKVATARTLWVPAVNNHGGFGRWAFLEVADPWDAQHLIRGFLQTGAGASQPRKSLMAKKTTTPTKVESIRHKDKRTNIPTEELRDFVADDEHAPKTMLYPRDPSLDPQLVWKGKDEQDREDLAVPVVPIYIQEKIHPQAIIDAPAAHRAAPATTSSTSSPTSTAARRLRRRRSTSTTTSRTGPTA